MAKCVELSAAGFSRDKIRQHLNYDMKVRTRMGGHWTNSRIEFLVQQGLRLMAETVKSDNVSLRLVGRRGRVRTASINWRRKQ